MNILLVFSPGDFSVLLLSFVAQFWHHLYKSKLSANASIYITPGFGTSVSSVGCSTNANTFWMPVAEFSTWDGFENPWKLVFHTTTLSGRKEINKIKFRYRLLAMIAMATHQNLGQALQEEKVPKLILTQDFKADRNVPACIGPCFWKMFARLLISHTEANLYLYARCSCWSSITGSWVLSETKKRTWKTSLSATLMMPSFMPF